LRPFSRLVRQHQINMERLFDYDAVGFDIDLTLGRYQLRNLVSLVYVQLADYLVKHRGYPDHLRSLDWSSPIECGLMSRAAILDKIGGNLLLMSPTGAALRVCHGSKQLDAKLAYPPDGRPPFAQAVLNSGYRHERDGRYRFQDTHYDLPGSLIFAKLVDLAEENRTTPLTDCSSLWQDCYSALLHVYSDDGAYFKYVLANPSAYLCPVTSGVRVLLKQLRQRGIYVFLLSSSEAQFAARHLEHILGQDWPDLFDACLLEAGKPNFFMKKSKSYYSSSASYYSSYESFERLPFGRGKAYISGCAEEFEWKFLGQCDDKTQSRKIAYFGDSVRSDLVTASLVAKWDIWMVIEELNLLPNSAGTVPELASKLIVKQSANAADATASSSHEGCRPSSDAWLAGLCSSKDREGEQSQGDDFTVNGEVTLWASMLASHATAVMSCLEDLLPV
ncbi:hypothetical protein BOX15_Mlig000760g6, partial [Macrostomum lignano]